MLPAAAADGLQAAILTKTIQLSLIVADSPLYWLKFGQFLQSQPIIDQCKANLMLYTG